MESNYSPKNKAFSLLELVVAVAILAIGIIVILQAFSFSARSTGIAGDIVNAVFLAKDKIQELEFKEGLGYISSEPRQAKDKAGKFTLGYALGLESDSNLYKLDLDINWRRANREEGIKLNTYLR